MNCKVCNSEMREEFSFVFGTSFYFCDKCKGAIQ